jgi:alkylation response protein AidB-like acyl-CoA dehydrogenase
VRLELSDEQQLLQSSLDRLATTYGGVDHRQIAYVHYSPDLQRELAEGGFLQIGAMEDYGSLDAALLVERIARIPFSVEAAASALVGPVLGVELSGPLALCEGLNRPTRYLSQAKHAILVDGDGFLFFDVDQADVQLLEGVIAYPLGELTKLPVGGTAVTS